MQTELKHRNIKFLKANKKYNERNDDKIKKLKQKNLELKIKLVFGIKYGIVLAEVNESTLPIPVFYNFNSSDLINMNNGNPNSINDAFNFNNSEKEIPDGSNNNDGYDGYD
ncbi:hypothetical protein RhiirC2_793328 [Rhizophagus irregularis]|uniref:Uncharacterized protein n=1 Tax=Rhizophagus irregularis TaxID=588596 RepID=A0A2N1MFM2_9GLOM|nr:hypothetical protein RhiirC2_793328 [Rhizophagus irregularis]